ncbi:MAG: hypothetical protein ACRD2D_09130 [Terriglobales bacterium]
MVIATNECPGCRASGKVAKEVAVFLRRQPMRDLNALWDNWRERLIG